jgi:hypothetical protein
MSDRLKKKELVEEGQHLGKVTQDSNKYVVTINKKGGDGDL